ncbi:TPA: hypothetical protein QEM96_003044 [Pseudomonas putida]|nr:hypothetical protein [Pseudomonas putida]
MPACATSTFDFKRAAALQFGDRPTLRHVVSEQLLKLLLAELPWLAYVRPALSSADALMLDSPDPATAYWSTQPLVDRVLQALIESNSVDLEPINGRHHKLGVVDPYRFAGSQSPFDTRQLNGLTGPLNHLIEQLPQHFCQAQLDYWRSQGSTGASRDDWLQLLLKTALLRGLPLQGLDAQEQACIRGLIRGGSDQPTVSVVQARLTTGAAHVDEVLCHLLVTGEWDERQVVLWCAPSGKVRGFASLAAFAVALRDELAQRYSFDAMSWQRYPLEGNVFAQQVGQLLETLFVQVERVRYGRLADIAALERLFAQLSDPAQWFDSYPDDTSAVQPPPGLLASDSVVYHSALLQIAVDQLDAEGVAALDGVQSLTDFTRQRLREQMRASHGDDTCPDALLLEFSVARGVPGGAATGAGGGEPLAFEDEKSLTEYAIGNLGALKDATITRIRRSDGAPIPLWLDVAAARQLVSEVDVGGHYPDYVARQLDDPLKRGQRVKRFGREWRSALRFSALTSEREGKLTEVGLQCVFDFCAGHFDLDTPRMTLMPLAFKRQPNSRQHDSVRGMYVLFCAEPPLVLLYRPLYPQDTLREYPSLDALLEHIQQSALLQTSILDWLDPQVRHIYDHGGFLEPHVGSIGIDPFNPPERPQPPVFHLRFWRGDIDGKLYDANRDLLIELANQQSTSNAERRWETLCQGAWLLFDVFTLVLRGPVATVAWLVQLLGGLQNDLLALEQGGEFNRSAAIADLLLNLGMMLLHAQQPTLQFSHAGQKLDASAFEGAAAQRGAFGEVTVVPAGGAEAAIGALATSPERRLDLSWRGNHGFNWLPPAQRQALRAMRVGIAFDESALLVGGEAAGLYRVEGRLYADMGAEPYPVEVVADGVRVIDGKGGHGPWLSATLGTWRVDTALRLAGGMRRGGTRATLARRFDSLRISADTLNEQVNAATTQFSATGAEVTELVGKITQLKTLRAREQAKLDSGANVGELESSRTIIGQYDARIAEWEASIANKREEAVRHLEKAVQKDKEILSTLETLFEPKFASARMGWEEAMSSQRHTVQVNQIRNNDFILNELWALADYPELVEIQKRLDRQPVQQELEAYHALRHKLEGVVQMQERMLFAYERLDELLVDAPGDLVISGPSEAQHRTVDSLISLRTFSTVQFRFHQALNLADLALNLDATTGQRKVSMFREELSGLALRNAAGAHGELDFANLPVEDRVVILQEAWDEYAEALVNSARISQEGGALVEVSMIDRYRTELEKLKRDAGRRLVEAIKEQEGASGPPRRAAYVVSSEPQRAVRNAEGQTLIGTERVVDGERVLEVRESFTGAVLADFVWQDGHWRERVSERAPLESQAESVDTAMRVQTLLDENDELSLKAQAYIDNDLNGPRLAQLFERQIDKLGREATTLGDEGANPALLRSLEAASDRLRSEKNLKLTTLYTNTHYPSAEALRFLHEQKLLKVEYVSPRQVMNNGSTFDEYKVMRLAQPGATSGRPLWVAHFHMRSADAHARDFTQGHLKTWSQRRMSGREEAAASVRVHRGKLTLEQASGIIPFD